MHTPTVFRKFLLLCFFVLREIKVFACAFGFWSPRLFVRPLFACRCLHLHQCGNWRLNCPLASTLSRDECQTHLVSLPLPRIELMLQFLTYSFSFSSPCIVQLQKSFTLILQALDMYNTSYPGKCGGNCNCRLLYVPLAAADVVVVAVVVGRLCCAHHLA